MNLNGGSPSPDEERSEEANARMAWFEAYCRSLEQSTRIEATDGESFPCPCCGYLTLDSRGGFEICPVCFWEDDGQDDSDADIVRGGPNGALSLTRARMNFRALGACQERFIAEVRPPHPDEIP